MDERTFTAALERAVEYRDALMDFQRSRPGYLETTRGTIWASFCGMGEPLVHPRAVEYVGRAAEAGLRPIVNTNGALLSPETAEELMDAGLEMACLNVGEVGEDYEAVYGLPFERTRTNVEHFLTASRGRCLASIILVDHRDDPDHVATVREYWSQRGARSFMPFGLVNRAGALPAEEQAATVEAFRHEARRMLQGLGAKARCGVPFRFPFIGYDGIYYLCSSDWRKEVGLGSVFERSLIDILDEKAEQVGGRSPICRGCTHEPTNAMALSLARAAGGRPDGAAATPDLTPDEWLAELGQAHELVEALRAHVPRSPGAAGPRTRRLIPVRS